MPRYRLIIEYDGSGFVGWQRQANGQSVQEAIERAVLGFSGELVDVVGAGRTDTGVHATHQVAHLDLGRDWTLDTVRDAINFHIRPHSVCILRAELAAPTFHARFDAISRAYTYVILNRKPPPVLERNQVWHVTAPLDADVMNDAAQELVGKHDYTTFRAAACQALSPVKTVDSLTVQRDGNHIIVHARARSFLHHQMRSFVGALRYVGEGKWSRADLADALAARNRARCAPVAPAGGLTLVAVDYPDDAAAAS